MNRPPDAPREPLTVFQMVLLLLSLLLLPALIADSLVTAPDEASEALQLLDNLACALFFIDVIGRFARAPDKKKFWKWGWLDLLACIPNIDILRVGRFARVLMIIRIWRGLRGSHRLFTLILRNQPRNVFGSLFLSAALLVSFSSIAILFVETTPEANIRTAGDAVWWSVTTMTTVGYGDKYPVTTAGRVVAMLLMVSGVGLFGALSGLIASFLMGSGNKDERADIKEVLERLRSLEEKIARIEKSSEHNSG